MADLTRPSRGVLFREPSDERGRHSGGRGQLILVAGFALAVAFIALALVLNAGIFTESLATQSESAGTTDAHVYQRGAERVALEAFHYANDVNDSDDYDELEANVTESVAAASTLSARERVRSGHVANYSVASTTRGTRVEDDGHFRSESDDQNWTVVENAHVRDFRVFVGSFNTSDEADLEFVVEGSTRNWTLNVSNSGVVVNASGTYYDCGDPGTNYWINFTDGTLDLGDCQGRPFAEDVSGDYDLHVINGSRVNGEYTLVTDKDLFARFSGTPITADRELYSMTVDFVYRTPELRYRTKIRIAPGEKP